MIAASQKTESHLVESSLQDVLGLIFACTLLKTLCYGIEFLED